MEALSCFAALDALETLAIILNSVDSCLLVGKKAILLVTELSLVVLIVFFLSKFNNLENFFSNVSL